MTTEVSNSLAPRSGESQIEHYRRVFPLTRGTTEERNAAVLDAWDAKGDEASELGQAAAKKFSPEKFHLVRRVPVFTEHSTARQVTDPKTGKPKVVPVVWDRNKLAAMVEQMNHRVLDTGAFPPITEGHTPDLDDVRKYGAKQPRVLGYQGNFRLGIIGNKKPRYAVFCDEYHHRDDADTLSRLTRRSPEVWPTDKPFYDPCAALGAETPRLDMGTTISYSRSGYWTAAGSDGAAVEKYSMADAAFPGPMNTHTPTDKYSEGASDDQANALVAAVVDALSNMPEIQAIRRLAPLVDQIEEMLLDKELPPDEDATPAAEAPQTEANAGEPDGDEAPAPPAPDPTAESPAPHAEPDGDESPAAQAPADDDASMMAKFMAGQISADDLKAYRDSKNVLPAADKYAAVFDEKKHPRSKSGKFATKSDVGDEDSDEDDLVMGVKVYHDPSGVGHNWKPISAKDIPANIREEIEGNIAEGEAGEITHSNGKKYRYEKRSVMSPEHYQLKAEFDALLRKKEQLAAEIAEQEANGRKSLRYSRLNALRDQGYEFELAGELSLTSDFTDAQFEAHCSQVVTKYARLPVGQRSFPVLEGDALPESEMARTVADRQLQRKAENYALAEAEKGNNIDMRTAMKYVLSQESTTSASVK